jgi:hypothetical protein
MIRKPDPVTICMAAIIYLSRWLPAGIDLPTLYPASFETWASSPQVLYVAFQRARFTRDHHCW